MPQRDSAQKIAVAVFLAAFFLAFTWRGIFVSFSGDDVTNLYRSWSRPASELVKANLVFWSPYYRPWGGVVYRSFFAIFGLAPRPLAAAYYAVLLLNLGLAYAVFRRLAGSAEVARLATLIFCVHGCLGYLYYNLGVLYDVFCFTFFFAALLQYLRIRGRGGYPGLWALAGILGLFICSLNSKEMAVAFPAILLVYEALFHRPSSRRPQALGRWFAHEGRTALLSSLLLIPYIPGKLAPEGLTSSPAYVPHVSWNAWLESTEQYLADLVYAAHPFSSQELLISFAVLAAVAWWRRSAVLWFGLLFFVITLLPVSFVSVRLGFVLYLPLAGLVLYIAALLVGIKNQFRLPAFAGTLLFLLTAASLALIHARHWKTPHDPSPVEITVKQFYSRLPDVHPGMRIMFVKDAFGGTYEMLYTLSLLYKEKELEIAQLDGRTAPEAATIREAKYDHIFTYENGIYREMDHADTQRSLRLNLLLDERTGKPAGGEMLVVGHPDQDAFFVADVLRGDPRADAYWTGPAPELKFLVSPNSRLSYDFTMRFYLPGQIFEKTGPVTIRFFVNDHLLDRMRYDSPEQHTYLKPVPSEWISRADYTTVRIEVENPYIAPGDGARLGFLLQSAGFFADRE
jgi:hypothetical protein